MSVTVRAGRGIAWSAASGWLQFGVSLGAFGIVAHRLSPAEIGSFGLAILLLSLVEAGAITPLGDSLQQRRSIDRAQINATFWIVLALAIGAALVLAAAAAPIAQAFSAPLAAPLLAWGSIGLGLSALTLVPHASLAREVRFDVIARASAAGSVTNGLVAIGFILAGAGVWSLLLADLADRLVRLAWLWHAARWRPSPPRELGAIGPLMRFNTGSAAIYLVGHLDRALPRLLAGLFLGAQALGYLVVAQRVLDLVTQLVLMPFSSVTMAAVARLQDSAAELRALVLRLYRLAAVFAYPAFLGLIVVTPDLALLAGDKWLPAIVPTQLLLLTGLRLTTGVFNIALFRGIGDNRTPMILLGSGLALNALLIPIGAAYGVSGIAAAVLVRVLATWPLGCWFVRRAFGLSFAEQALSGTASLLAALAMAGTTALVAAATPDLTPLVRLITCIASGVLVYGSLLLLLRREFRVAAWRAASMLARGERVRAVHHLRSSFSN